jgi:hypothetical protein
MHAASQEENERKTSSECKRHDFLQIKRLMAAACVQPLVNCHAIVLILSLPLLSKVVALESAQSLLEEIDND